MKQLFCHYGSIEIEINKLELNKVQNHSLNQIK